MHTTGVSYISSTAIYLQFVRLQTISKSHEYVILEQVDVAITRFPDFRDEGQKAAFCRRRHAAIRHSLLFVLLQL